MVLFMLTLMLFAYKRALNSQAILADIQTQEDYREKEESVLRSIVAITPNRAIRAMQDGSNSSNQRRNPLMFKNIFKEALEQSNAKDSISPQLLASLEIPATFKGNTGDSSLVDIEKIFGTVKKTSSSDLKVVSSGLRDDLGSDYPPVLNTASNISNDDVYPIITDRKIYGSRASSRSEVQLPTSKYDKFNLIPYPNIDFGYATPGEPFVAKRNWWAFNMDLAAQDAAISKLAPSQREFVLSIYEIPSQLPISTGAFMALGKHASGEEWQNVTISGNVFAGRAQVEGSTALASLATRRGGTKFSAESTIGGESFAGSNPFTPGIRENYRVNNEDGFFPVSLASESGKVAFVPINRGALYFDRFDASAKINDSATISPTGWNDYSIGARQCAMTLDITQCVSRSDRTPTQLRFTYLKSGIRTPLTISLNSGPASGLPVGYIQSVREGSSAYFESHVDVAYGANGKFYFRDNVIGTIRFDNQTFGDPLYGTYKYGWYRPRYPFEIKKLPSGQTCIAFYPERLRSFLKLFGVRDKDLAENNSIAINVDYPGSTNLDQPTVPQPGAVYNEAFEYGVILEECADLSSFAKGFSLVTNMRLYIGDDFNVVGSSASPSGWVPPDGRRFYPPCSLFAPDKRYGTDFDPFAIELSGQVGSVASDNAADPVRPLDVTGASGTSLAANRIKINLSTISHPDELPPIYMMNWLVLVEEKRRETN